MFAGVKGLHIQADDFAAFAFEQAPGAGGEISQACANGQNHVRLLGADIGRTGAGDTQRPQRQRRAVRHSGFTGLCFRHRNAMTLGKDLHLTFSLRIQHAATRNDEGALCGFEQGYGLGQFKCIGGGAARTMDAALEKALRIIIGLGLHILTEGQCHRPAVHRVGQHAHGAVKRGNDLLRAGDAVKIARHRLEAIIGRDRAIAEILDLLQNRIRATIGKDIAGNQQYGQAVDMGHGGGGHHIGGARPDGGGAGHHAAAARRLGKGHSSMGHALLIMGAVSGQRVARGIKRLAQPRHIAMAENGPDTGKNRLFLPVDFGHLHT